MLKRICVLLLCLVPLLALADIKVTAQAGNHAALLTWNGDPGATYAVVGREQGTTAEVKRSIYPVKGNQFLDAALETKTFEYKVQQIDGSGKMTAESGWVSVTPTGQEPLIWAINPPGDPDEPFEAGAGADGPSGEGKMYVDGAFYANTVSQPHATNSQLHIAKAKVNPADLAPGEHSLVVTVPANGGFMASSKMFVKTAGGGGGAAGSLPLVPIAGGVVGLVVIIALVSIAKKPKATE